MAKKVNDEFEVGADLPNDPCAGWPTIEIDEPEGGVNYEVVCVNGKEHQIMCGVPVRIPPEVYEVLQHAVETHYEQNLVTGHMKISRRSGIRWRRVA